MVLDFAVRYRGSGASKTLPSAALTILKVKKRAAKLIHLGCFRGLLVDLMSGHVIRGRPRKQRKKYLVSNLLRSQGLGGYFDQPVFYRRPERS